MHAVPFRVYYNFNDEPVAYYCPGCKILITFGYRSLSDQQFEWQVENHEQDYHNIDRS